MNQVLGVSNVFHQLSEVTKSFEPVAVNVLTRHYTKCFAQAEERSRYRRTIAFVGITRRHKHVSGALKEILKGQCHEIFCFWFFSWVSFPPAPEYPIRTISNFLENSRRYSLDKVHHRCQRHRRQILPPVSLVLLIPMANLPPVVTIPAANLPPVSTTTVTNCHRKNISDCRLLKENLKAKIYIYVNSTT